MRSPDEQEDFLEHGRFGEGKQSVAKTHILVLVKIGLAFIVLGFACLGTTAVLAEWARQHGQWYLFGEVFVHAFIFLGSIGVGFCLLGLVSRLVRGRRR